MPTIEIDEDAEPALLGDLERLSGTDCAGCRKVICGHEVLFSVAMGAKDALRCLPCLARALDRTSGELRDDLTEHFRHRRCYARAWEVACRSEGQPHSYSPRCLANFADAPARTAPGANATRLAIDLPPTDVWNAGDMSCGDLVLALRIRLNGLPAASVLQVTALDPAAPLDLPAWCRLTGHRLIRASHPTYLIQRKEH